MKRKVWNEESPTKVRGEGENEEMGIEKKFERGVNQSAKEGFFTKIPTTTLPRSDPTVLLGPRVATRRDKISILFSRKNRACPALSNSLYYIHTCQSR